MTDSKRPVLEVRNLSVSLPTGADRVHAVEKVSFTVSPGEIVCLVGESGSGKSVIAFTVMGLLAKALPVGGALGSRPMMPWAITDLPEPDSPTRQTISPGLTVKLTFSTA